MLYRPNKGNHVAGKLSDRLRDGVWLGVNARSGEHFIGTADGVVKCRDIKRISEERDRWNKERVLAAQGAPWQTIPGRKGVQILPRLPIEAESENVYACVRARVCSFPRI